MISFSSLRITAEKFGQGKINAFLLQIRRSRGLRVWWDLTLLVCGEDCQDTSRESGSLNTPTPHSFVQRAE